MTENEPRERNPAPAEELDADRKPGSQPPATAPATIPPRQKKPGPSIDIGPGPGADVVATPPRRISRR